MVNKTGKIFSLSSEEFKDIVDKSNSLKEMLDYIGLGYRGHSYDTLKERLKLEGFPIPNGLQYREYKRYNIQDVLVEHSNYISTHNLKKRLWKEGLLANQCYICGQMPSHNGLPLSLQLDHINGVHNDHRLENLRILCPNCHTQTSTYSGKNSKQWDKEKFIKHRNAKKNKNSNIKIENDEVKIVLSEVEMGYDEFKNVVSSMVAKDICANFSITLQSLRGVCKELNLKLKYKLRISKIPLNKTQLEELLSEFPKEHIGKMFGVSGKAIGKKCVALGIDNGNMRGYWAKKRAQQ